MARALVATYRIQLTPGFGFDAAAAIVPDLARLGVSHLYLSPVAEAVTASTHGYDVVDPSEVRRELGGEDGLRRLAHIAEEHGLALIVDIVPNHVSSVEPHRNPWWWDLLRNGPDSDAASHFDVDWDVADGRVIVPVLGNPIEDAITAGDLRLEGDRVRSHERTFPLRPDVEPTGTGPDDLAALLAQQHYRLEHWRSPDRNVRRFFTIDDLVAIRPEVPAVAEAVDRVVGTLAEEGRLGGVRVDHVDGLADPEGYLAVLRAHVGGEPTIHVEKIIVGDERLPASWPVEGTTGYEWITLVDHLFTHPAGEVPLTGRWHALTDDTTGYHAIEADGIRHVLATNLRPDLERVARTGEDLLGVPAADLVDPLIDLTVGLGRYRTYLPTDVRPTAERLETEVELVRQIADSLDDPASTGRGLVGRLVDGLLAGTELTRRWQQLTGPALAKGGEDRALYRWFRLAAHNEVGGDPSRWTTAIEDFHAHNHATLEASPATLLAGSTHDTKRAEDTRARLLALAELPDRWLDAADRWGAHVDAPDERSRWLALQTVVAAWPIDEQRLGDYLVKAAREAEISTSWTDPDVDHESALQTLATALTRGPLRDSIATFVDEIEPAARAISLAQLTLRLTAPGVADLYQGSERWMHLLVDPDNRRPIDQNSLRRAVETATAAGSVWASSLPKAAVINRVLSARRRHLACFGAASSYVPMHARGRHADHVIAFARGDGTGAAATTVLTVAARFPNSRPAGWDDTTLDLPTGDWWDELDERPHAGGSLALADLLGDNPAALLTVR